MRHILVVEDNEINQDLIVRRLKRKGFKVSLAVDGKQGLDMIKELLPDLVLLDMSLPVLDGWDVAKACKQDQAIKNIPIIALTAHAMDGDRSKALSAGCDEYETKPIEVEKLFPKIEALIARAPQN